jgi:hypothetical protein
MIFGILLLAHIIADFPLQTDRIYRWKQQSAWGLAPHIMVHVVINVLLLSPFWRHTQVWIALLALAGAHAVVDRTKVILRREKPIEQLPAFAVDQVVHLILIAAAAFWLTRIIGITEIENSWLFDHRTTIVQLTVLSIAAFAGTPILHFITNFWRMRHGLQPEEYPKFIKRVPGIFERLLATLGVLWGGWWLWLAPAAFFPRMMLNWRDEGRSLSLLNAAMGLSLSIVCGLLAV